MSASSIFPGQLLIVPAGPTVPGRRRGFRVRVDSIDAIAGDRVTITATVVSPAGVTVKEWSLGERVDAIRHLTVDPADVTEFEPAEK